MDYEPIFSLLYSLNKKRLLSEKISISYKLNSTIISENKVIKKKASIETSICEIKIEENSILLIKDIPINFISHFSILLGDKTRLISFRKEKSDILYYCDERLVSEIGNVITNSIKKVNPQILKDKKILHKPFLEKINSIQKYCSEIKKINLDKIHIVDSKELELFLPTIKFPHFSIAKRLGIPLKNLIKNNTFQGTNLNIYDTQALISLIKPLITKREPTILATFNNNIVFKDITSTLNLKLNKKKLNLMILELEESNYDYSELISFIKYKNQIEIGSKSESEILLPIFKENEFKIFENLNEFKKTTGVNFKAEKEFLKNIKIQKNAKIDYNFKEYYLNPKLIWLVLGNNLNSNEIKSKTQALCKLSYHEEIKSLYFKEEINNNQIQELTKHIKSLAKFTIIKSVEFNCVPKEKRAQSLIEQYLISKISKLYLKNEEYTKNKSKKLLLKEILKHAQKVSELKKTLPITKDELYFFHQICLSYLKILNQFNKEKANSISSLLEEYFKENKIKIFKSKISHKHEKIIEDIILLHKIYKKKEILLDRKEKLYENLFPNNISLLPNKEISKIYYRGNTLNLRKISPYSYKEILEEINGEKLPKTITLRKKTIPTNSSHYISTRIHNEYKEIISNDIFSIFVKK